MKLVTRCARGTLAALLLLPGAPVGVLAAADVRVLVDVSGSMRETDPANLRVPALRLVTDLLPAGTEAGIWMFAEDAMPLVAPAPVDETWRAQARAALGQIHSRGLFTHIEDAIAAAIGDWEASSEPAERHVILLTDGMVDVSKEPGASAASRQRILGPQLERLGAVGARVHAIALSDAVDRELVETLTGGTGGWLEQASDAERLQRIFLRMLEQSAPPLTVPIEGNRFEIDDSVSELTLLVFRGTEETTVLHAPDGSSYSAAILAAGVSWHAEAGYDLVTVSAPPAGTWRFDGATDPDNRAVIVTDLKMEVGGLPGSLAAGESARLTAEVHEYGAQIERIDLLELLTTSAALSPDDDSATHVVPLPLDREAARFAGAIDGGMLEPGTYRVAVLLDGITFRRQVNQRLRIAPAPVTVRYGEVAAGGASVRVEITPDPALTRADSLGGYLEVRAGEDHVQALPVPPLSEGTAVVEVEALASGEHRLAPRLVVDSADGRALRLEPTAATRVLTPPAPVAEPEPEPPPPPRLSLPRLGAYLGAGHAVLALGLALVWMVFGRRPRAPALAAEAA